MDKNLAISLHNALIKEFGGNSGVRDEEHLVSAISRMNQMIDGNPVYDSVTKKACALLESIIINHPFIEGNARTGYVIYRHFMLSNGVDIVATEEEKNTFVLKIAKGVMSFDKVLAWTEERIVKL